MFFTHLARMIAIVALVLATFRLAIGVMIATEYLGPYETTLARYAPGVLSSGETINQSLMAILASVVLGILTDISYGLRAK